MMFLQKRYCFGTLKMFDGVNAEGGLKKMMPYFKINVEPCARLCGLKKSPQTPHRMESQMCDSHFCVCYFSRTVPKLRLSNIA